MSLWEYLVEIQVGALEAPSHAYLLLLRRHYTHSRALELVVQSRHPTHSQRRRLERPHGLEHFQGE